MLRAIIIGIGLATMAIGLQCFCLQELTIKTDIVKAVSIADFLPYSLICSGLIIYLYGYQLQHN